MYNRVSGGYSFCDAGCVVCVVASPPAAGGGGAVRPCGGGSGVFVLVPLLAVARPSPRIGGG